MRGNVGVLGFRAVGVAVGYGARGAGARMLFVEGVGVDEGAVAGLGLGAVVEDPDNLWVVRRVLCLTWGHDLRRSWRGGCNRLLRLQRERRGNRRGSLRMR